MSGASEAVGRSLQEQARPTSANTSPRRDGSTRRVGTELVLASGVSAGGSCSSPESAPNSSCSRRLEGTGCDIAVLWHSASHKCGPGPALASQFRVSTDAQHSSSSPKYGTGSFVTHLAGAMIGLARASMVRTRYFNGDVCCTRPDRPGRELSETVRSNRARRVRVRTGVTRFLIVSLRRVKGPNRLGNDRSESGPRLSRMACRKIVSHTQASSQVLVQPFDPPHDSGPRAHYKRCRPMAGAPSGFATSTERARDSAPGSPGATRSR